MIKIHGKTAYVKAFYYNPYTQKTDEIILCTVSTEGECIEDVFEDIADVELKSRNSTKHKDYEDFTPQGKEFIDIWNAQDRDGGLDVVAKHFGMSIPTVYRIRKKLKLAELHSKEHPGKRALYKRIKKLYYEYNSTHRVGMVVGMSSQRVNQILREQNVELGPKHIVSVAGISPKNGMSVTEFMKSIRELHYEGHTCKSMSLILKVDQSTISKRMKILGLKPKQNHQSIYGGYSCLWCGKIMEHVWIAHGPRQQKFCSGSCKNRAKDYRRYVFGQDRIKQFEQYIKSVWGEDWQNKKEEILGRKKWTKKILKSKK